MAYVQAVSGFIVVYDGKEELVQAGERIDESHAIVRGNPHLFEPAVDRFPVQAEEATTRKKRVTKAAEDESGQE